MLEISYALSLFVFARVPCQSHLHLLLLLTICPPSHLKLHHILTESTKPRVVAQPRPSDPALSFSQLSFCVKIERGRPAACTSWPHVPRLCSRVVALWSALLSHILRTAYKWLSTAQLNRIVELIATTVNEVLQRDPQTFWSNAPVVKYLPQSAL